MALVLDTWRASASNGSSAGQSITCDPASRLLLVWIYRGNTSSGATSVTYNGVAMTRKNGRASGTESVVELWYLVDPPTGSSYNVLATFPNSHANYIVAESWLGTSPIDPFRSTTSSVGSGTTMSTSLTAGQSHSTDKVVGGTVSHTPNTMSGGSGVTTVLSLAYLTYESLYISLHAGYKNGSNSFLTYTTYLSGSANWAQVIASLVAGDSLSLTTPSSTPSAGSVAFAGSGVQVINLTTPASMARVGSVSFASIREARTTITDFSQNGRWIALALSRAGDGADFEVNLIDVDVRLRGKRVWRDI